MQSDGMPDSRLQTVSPHGEQASNSVFGETFLGGGPGGPEASRTSSRGIKPSRTSSRSSIVCPPPAVMESLQGCYAPSCRAGTVGAKCYSPSCPRNRVSWKMRNGVFEVHDDRPWRQGLFPYIEFTAWQRDNNALLSLLVDGATKSFAYGNFDIIFEPFLASFLALCRPTCSMQCSCVLDAEWSLRSDVMTNARLQVQPDGLPPEAVPDAPHAERDRRDRGAEVRATPRLLQPAEG